MSEWLRDRAGPLERVRRDAIAHYNERARGADRDVRAGEDAGEGFLDRITVNYLRHAHSRYDAVLDRAATEVEGLARSANRVEVRRQVMTEIAAAYPELADECQRQMDRDDEHFQQALRHGYCRADGCDEENETGDGYCADCALERRDGCWEAVRRTYEAAAREPEAGDAAAPPVCGGPSGCDPCARAATAVHDAMDGLEPEAYDPDCFTQALKDIRAIGRSHPAVAARWGPWAKAAEDYESAWVDVAKLDL